MGVNDEYNHGLFSYCISTGKSIGNINQCNKSPVRTHNVATYNRIPRARKHTCTYRDYRSQDSTDNIANGYGLDDRGLQFKLW
jgi:hypothetical protein